MENGRTKFRSSIISHKTLVGLIVILVFLAGLLSDPPAIEAAYITGCYRVGDVNNDTDVTNVDVTYVQNHLVGLNSGPIWQKYRADMDDSGTVDATDAIWIQWAVAGSVTAADIPKCTSSWRAPQACFPTGNIYTGNGSRVDDLDALVVLEIEGGINTTTSDTTCGQSGDVDNHRAGQLTPHTHSCTDITSADATLIGQYSDTSGSVLNFSLANGNRGCYYCSGASCLVKSDIMDSPTGYTSSSCNNVCVAVSPIPTPTPTTAPTPTPTPTSIPPTPTPVPGTYTISGDVFVDANNSSTKDAGEVNYDGALVQRTGSGSLIAPACTAPTQITVTSCTSTPSYSFTGLPAGPYTVTLNVPAGSTPTTATSVPVPVGPDGTADFGICFDTFPAPASDPSPGNDATGVAVTTNLSWTFGSWGTFCPGNGNGYHVYISDTYSDPLAGPIVQGLPPDGTTGTYDPFTPFDPNQDLNPDTAYYWRITQCNEGGSWRCTDGQIWSFTTAATYTISGNVFIDNNGNGAQDVGEPNYTPGTNVGRDGSGSPLNVTTDGSGNYSFTNLTEGTYDITLTVPFGYFATTPNQVSRFVGPDTTANFGIEPSCTVTPGTNFLRGCYYDTPWNDASNIQFSDPSVSAPDGEDAGFPPVPDSFVALDLNPPTPSQDPPGTEWFSAIWEGNFTFKAGTYTFYLGSDDGVKLYVDSGAGLAYRCGDWVLGSGRGYTEDQDSCSVTFSSQVSRRIRVEYWQGGGGRQLKVRWTYAPTYTISGNVFVDDGAGGGTPKNGIKDIGELNWTGPQITITSTGGTVSAPCCTGAYTVNNLLTGGPYIISYTQTGGSPGPPAGYYITGPTNGPPPSYSLSVPPSAGNKDFGIALVGPWIQSTCTDIRFDSGFNYPVPSTATCGPYASIQVTCTTPGIIFTGNSNPQYLGQPGYGSASSKNWVVGGSSYPELFIPSRGNVIRTSYKYMDAQIKQAGLPTTPITNWNANCINSTGCSLTGIAHGLYSSNSNGSNSHVYINLSTLNCTKDDGTSPGNCVFLINGNLNILGNIRVNTGATATFIVSGDIIVAGSIGETVISSTTSDIEGYYSTDKSFIIQGTNNCSVGTDKRLNIAGSVIVNAGLAGGTFQNLRDLCAGNASCPVFSIQERPDFMLNAPDLIKYQNTIYQEVAP